jgi:hypothetical protein
MLRYALIGIALAAPLVADDPPREWIEATGHRVVRLSDQPGTASLYFHQNPYTATGDKMVVSTPQGLATIALATREIKPLVEGRIGSLVVGRKTRTAYYMKSGAVYATNVDTGATRTILEDARIRGGSGFGLSADETLLAGSFVKGDAAAAPPRSTSAPPTAALGAVARSAEAAPPNPLATPPPQESSLEARWAQRLPMAIYTIDIKSGALKIVYESNDWLNHVQSILIGVLMTTTAHRAAQTIPELARARGQNPVVRGVVRDVTTAPLETVAKEASLVVVGRLRWMRSYLTSDQMNILTDFAIEPENVVAGQLSLTQAKPAAAAVPTLTVYGGEVTVDGVRVSAVDHNMDLPRSGGKFLLFLRPFGAEPGRYELVRAAIFEVDNDRLRPLLKRADTPTPYADVTAGTLPSAIAGVVRARR